MSKHAAALLLHLPWERIDPSESPGRRGAWSTHDEDALLPSASALVFHLRADACLAPLPHPFDDARVSLNDAQRQSLREWLGLARAARLVEGEGHAFLSWSLLKDGYMAETVTGAPAPSLTRAQALASVEPGAHVIAVFDSLMLKASGGSSPELTALSLLVRDLHDKGCSLTALSRYPLFAPGPVEPSTKGDAWNVLGGGPRRFYRDERGKARTTAGRTAEAAHKAPRRMSFQGALDEGTFERLAWMLAESEGKWREGER